jgi:hypothetical protein
MQTDTIWAYEVENNDNIVIDGEHVGYVYMKEDDGDGILLDVVDDDGDHTQYPFGPFDSVTIVTSFLDEDSTDGEDVFIEV